ncbi:MAG: HD domain-containing protein [Deferribacterota bacterium]|nr:HD domain-containing protein [Deferribacterota bacterium]
MELNIVEERFLIIDVNENLTKDNKPYLRFILYDEKSKQYSGIMFNIKNINFRPSKGDIVKINGILQNYNGQVQLKISKMFKLEGESHDDFLPRSMYDLNIMLETLKKTVLENIKDEYLKKLCVLFFEDNETVEKFKKSPAAKSIHHPYIGGLLEHTLSVVRLAVFLSKHYSDYVNSDLLLVGSLFHDLGKIYELEAKEGIDYTDCGRLVGHLLLGIEKINEYINRIDSFPATLKNLLIHMIASHHGYLEYGSPQLPKTYEALILYYIDDLDAKLNNFNQLLEREGVDEGWSSYNKILERQIFKHNR